MIQLLNSQFAWKENLFETSKVSNGVRNELEIILYTVGIQFDVIDEMRFNVLPEVFKRYSTRIRFSA